MSVDDRRFRADWLAEIGVPAPFRDPIIDAPNDWMTTRGAAVPGVALVVMAIGAMVAVFFLLDGYVQARAAGLAAETGASLTYVNVGIGPLLLLFGALALVGLINSMIATRYRVKGVLSLAAAAINWPVPQALVRRLVRWIVGGSVRTAAGRAATVDGFLHAMAVDQARRSGIAALILLTPAVVLTALETNSFWVAGPSGIVEHRMLPPFSSRRHELKEVVALTTGCNHTDRTNRLIYDVHLGSGESFKLGDAKAVSGSRIGAIEKVDARIERGVEHRRWSHLDRNPTHPACLGYWASQFDGDGLQRLTKLLRLTPQELSGSR
jgi:hypothetical protein